MWRNWYLGASEKQTFISVEKKLLGYAMDKCSFQFCFFPHYLSKMDCIWRGQGFPTRGLWGTLNTRYNQQRSSSLQAVTSHSGSHGLVCLLNYPWSMSEAVLPLKISFVLPLKISFVLPHPMCFSALGTSHGFRLILSYCSNVVTGFLVISPLLVLLIHLFPLESSEML